MTVLQLHILCKATTKEAESEDLRLAKQLEELGVQTSTPKPEEPQEWRKGYIFVNAIEAFYPYGNNQENSMVHCVSGAVITVKEPVDYIAEILSNLNNNTNGQCNYNYTIPKI